MAFDPWAQYNQGLQNLGGTLSNINTQDLQRQTSQRQNSLADLQIQQGNMEMDKAALNAPLEAKQRQATSISLDDKIAEYGAKVAAGQGDINEYYKSKQALDRMKQMGEAIKPYMNKPDALNSVWPQLTQAFPEFKNIDPKVFKATPDGIMTPFETPDGQEVPNMFYLYDNEGKMQIKEVKPEKQGKIIDKTVDLGDKVIIQYADGTEKTMPKAAKPDTVIRVGQSTGNKKPMPPAALRMQQDAVDAVGLASSLRADLGAIKQQVESGELQLGPISNVTGTVLNKVGLSTDNSRNLATFKATLEKLRNDSLRLNKGVQTEGDAQRAWNELLTNITDEKLVSQRLNEIDRINERASMLQEENIANIRENYGRDTLDTSKQKNVKPALGKVRKIGKYAVEVH